MRLRLLATALTVALTLSLSAECYAAPKKLGPDGRVPAKWDQPKPLQVNHPDVAPLAAGGDGTGYNTLSFSSFDDGDMVVTGGSPTGHAGEWDERYYLGSLADKCIWSANTAPVNGVQREEPRKYRAYDNAWGLWVPSVPVTKRTAARSYCKSQSGEPYDISSSKTDTSRWYCSKLAWGSYKSAAGIDLDADGGYWVWPIDLVNDSQTAVFASAK